MAEKQTAGRDQLGDFAPKFAELNDDVYLDKYGPEKNYLLISVVSSPYLH